MNVSTHIVLKLRVKQVTYESSIYIDSTKRPKSKESHQGILGISSREFTHFAGNSGEGLRSRRECC